MSLYQAVSWISFLHLFVLGGLVLFKARKHSAFRFFAVFLFSFSYVHLNHILVLYNKAAAMWMVNEIVFLTIFLLGPVFLQFVAEMLGEKINWQKYLYLHLIPFLCFLVYYSSFLFNDRLTLEAFYAESLYRQPFSSAVLTSFAALQKGIYVYWSLLLLRRHFKNELEGLVNVFKNEEQKKIPLNTELKQKVYDVTKSFRQFLNILNEH